MTDVYSAFDREPVPAKVAGDPPGFDRSRWGLFPDFDIAKYHAGMIEELSFSQSACGRLLNETPLDYAYNSQQINPDAEKLAATVAMRRGDIVHQLALGRGKGYFILPPEFKDFKKGDAQKLRDAAIERGETPCLAHKFEEAQDMAVLLRDLIEEACEGHPFETEVAFLYQEQTSSGPIWVRGMLDVWCPDLGLILDPKITPMLYDQSVGRHMYNMGWDRQAALYPHAVGKILGPKWEGRIRFRDLFVNPNPPHTHRIGRLSKADEYQAIKECVDAMEIFGRCVHAGDWPGFEGETTIDLPAWVRKAREARETGEAA